MSNFNDLTTCTLKETGVKPHGLAPVFFLLLFIVLSGCSGFTGDRARAKADRIATQAGWHSKIYPTETFDIQTYQPVGGGFQSPVTIVIEGDGRAWLNRNSPSSDPTPQDPTGLKLALGLGSNAVYLARPCQYVSGALRRNCSAVFWTNARFATEVIRATHTVIDQILAESTNPRIRLIGFSGGGTLAALLASEREDVDQLITIASPLDTKAWARHHNISELRNSRNPADDLNTLSKIPQIHISGEKDKIVPPALHREFVKKMPIGHLARLITVPDANHFCCWHASHIIQAVKRLAN